MNSARLVTFLTIFGALVPAAVAQKPLGVKGFDFLAAPFASGEERQAQNDLWVFELQFRSLRLIELDVTDPRTRMKKKELIYYLTYRAVNREIERQEDLSDTVPVNVYDKDPVPDLFIPQITLVSNDNGVRIAVPDSIIPEAQAAIQRRERIRVLVNSVTAVQRIPPVVAVDATDPPAIYGIAMFRNVNPETDFFTLFLSGFSNGYKLVKGPVAYADLQVLADAGEIRVNDQIWNGDFETRWQAAAGVGDLFKEGAVPPADADTTQWYYTVPPEKADDTVVVWRKTLIQKYWRPGDKFKQNEREVRAQGDPRWIYRPDDAPDKPQSDVTTASTPSGN
jgi:hypothetical protein